MAGSDKAGQLGSIGSISDSEVSRNETTDGFHYDALDNLIGRTTSAGREQRFYRSNELANEINGNINTTFVRVEGVVLAEHRTGGGPGAMLLAGDDKNSVLSDVSQGAVKNIAYSAYGHRSGHASVNFHLGYNGERRETQTGWYLLGNGYRVFNPLLMRFHSPDNLSPFGEGGLNAYMYCVGDPINNVDPTGHTVLGFFSRSFRGLFGSNRITTATPGAKELPSVLRLNPHEKTRSTSLLPIRPKDVNRLERRADLQLELAAKFKNKDAEKYSMYQRFYEKDHLAHSFAKEHQGEKLITKYGREAAKNSSERLAVLERRRAKEKNADFLHWQANKVEEIRTHNRDPKVIRSYLGVDFMGARDS
ncbi:MULTISPECIES: RHS repeat-associated core domain-containing protein [Pseudomonas]|uniref:RHS repeat-associated core domain-containing protein n=1 Tax=Pseudomonas TaxID=286 RepID=UPI001E44F954|nr:MULTISPECIES: RHS repeat-associated core domain-containing protein [Pseudomonas]MCD4531760.1 hypothetical protein [Pseudomonas sp. C3-2018]